ncbi:MAG: hypothetical protein JRI65_14605 [Deltaproteobacteria bacterium]|nr:hypothetical protein [Deltaproteobacteria bacterium]
MKKEAAINERIARITKLIIKFNMVSLSSIGGLLVLDPSGARSEAQLAD